MIAPAPTLLDADARETFIASLDENFCVSAGAGVGKTTAITRRIATLALQRHGERSVLSKLVVVTYGKLAAEELRIRTRDLVVQQLGQSAQGRQTLLADLRGAFFGTIHGLVAVRGRTYPERDDLGPGTSVRRGRSPCFPVRCSRPGCRPRCVCRWPPRAPGPSTYGAAAVTPGVSRAVLRTSRQPSSRPPSRMIFDVPDRSRRILARSSRSKPVITGHDDDRQRHAEHHAEHGNEGDDRDERAPGPQVAQTQEQAEGQARSGGWWEVGGHENAPGASGPSWERSNRKSRPITHVLPCKNLCHPSTLARLCPLPLRMTEDGRSD